MVDPLDTQTKKKKSKTFWIWAALLPILLFTAVHLFVTRQVRRLLPTIVESLTEGEYSLSYEKLSFDYFNPYLRLTGAELQPLKEGMTEQYRVKVDSLYLSLESLIPIFLNDAVNVKEIRLASPAIEVRQNLPRKEEKNGGELHEQVNRMQDNAMKFLNALSVDRCTIVNGSFRYFPNPGRPGYFNIEHVDLDIQDLLIPEYKAGGEAEISAWINVSIREPNLRIPDSLLRVEVDHFNWDNRKHVVDVGKFAITQRSSPPVSDSFRISLDEIRIHQIDWRTWLDSGIIRLDTLLARDGRLYFESSAGNGRKKVNRDTVDLKKLKFWDAIGDLEVGHFAARYINAAILNRNPGEERNNSLLGDSLIIRDLSIRTDRNNPLQISELGLGVREFVDRGSDNRFHSSFSRLMVKDRTIVLNNYLAQATKRSRFGEGSRLLIPELTMEGVSLQEIFDKKASIKTIRMASPDLLLFTERRSKSQRPFNLEGLEEVRPYIDVEKLVLDNARIVVRDRQDTSITLGTRQFSAVILTRAAIRAKNMESLLTTFKDVNMDQVFYVTPRVRLQLYDGKVDYGNKVVTFGRVQGHLNNGKVHADLSNVAVIGSEDVRPFGKDVLWHFRKIDVGGGQVEIMADSAADESEKAAAADELLGHVDSLNLFNVMVRYTSPTIKGSTMLNRLKVLGYHVYPRTNRWKNMEAEMDEVSLEGRSFRVRSSGAALQSNGRSVLNDTEVEVGTPGMDLKVVSPELSFAGRFNQVDIRKVEFEEVALSRPVIRIGLRDSAGGQAVDSNGNGNVAIGRFRLDQPSITVSMENDRDDFELVTRGEHIRGEQLTWNKSNGKTGLSFQALQSELDTVRMFNRKEEIMRSGSVSAVISSFAKSTGLHPLMSIAHFNIRRIDVGRIRGADTMEIRTDGVTLANINGLVLQKDSMLQAAMKLPPITVLPGTFRFSTPNKQVSILNLKVNTEQEYMEWDSLSLVNRMDRDLSFALQSHEKDYITLRTGRVRADDLKPVIFGRDTTVYIRKLTLDPLDLKVERDKRVPDDTVSYRPLLARMFRKIAFPINIDSIELHRSTVWHNVIDEKTEKEGTIFFTDITGHVLKVKNFDYQERDSVSIAVSAGLMGKGQMRFRFRQSYTDTAQEFLMGVRMGVMEMEELNRLMVPMNSVRIDRGVIDDVSMRVKGNDSIAYGTMDINYDDLKLSVLNEQNKRRGLVSWFANIFVRGKNHKTGIIYTERLKEKSVFNFWSRISLAGLMTNLGVRKNGKQVRKFYRGLGKDQLPPDLF
jgi:hypothetical protein